MGKHTPTLKDPQNYLESHLGNELYWTLRAATEWYVQDTLNLNIGGYQMQVYAMDSAFLHARTLFEFFSHKTTDNYYGYDVFKIIMPSSVIYNSNWKSPLHAHMMHAQDRSIPHPLTSFDRKSKKDLNKMPMDFAKEIVRVWREFILFLSEKNPNLANIAEEILKDAISGANAVFENEVTREMAQKKNKTILPIEW